MLGARFFPPHYFGRHYFGPASGGAVVVLPPAQQIGNRVWAGIAGAPIAAQAIAANDSDIAAAEVVVEPAPPPAEVPSPGGEPPKRRKAATGRKRRSRPEFPLPEPQPPVPEPVRTRPQPLRVEPATEPELPAPVVPQQPIQQPTVPLRSLFERGPLPAEDLPPLEPGETIAGAFVPSAVIQLRAAQAENARIADLEAERLKRQQQADDDDCLAILLLAA